MAFLNLDYDQSICYGLSSTVYVFLCVVILIFYVSEKFLNTYQNIMYIIFTVIYISFL